MIDRHLHTVHETRTAVWTYNSRDVELEYCTRRCTSLAVFRYSERIGWYCKRRLGRGGPHDVPAVVARKAQQLDTQATG